MVTECPATKSRQTGPRGVSCQGKIGAARPLHAPRICCAVALSCRRATCLAVAVVTRTNTGCRGGGSGGNCGQWKVKRALTSLSRGPVRLAIRSNGSPQEGVRL